jgi:D-sedoheptulose 7-phosphate isomerase
MSEFIKNLNLHLKILKEQKLELNNKINLFSKIIINAFNNGGKLLIIGNGGSAADAQHLATELVVRMAKNRKALPALALTTDTSVLTATGNDFNYNYVFSRQIEAIGRENDVLLSISTSGKSKNIINAIKTANKMKLNTLSLLGNKGGSAKKISKNFFIVKNSNPSRVQEIHIIFYHNVCQIIEDYFFKK